MGPVSFCYLKDNPERSENKRQIRDTKVQCRAAGTSQQLLGLAGFTVEPMGIGKKPV